MSPVAVTPSSRSSRVGSSGAIKASALMLPPPEAIALQIAPLDVPQTSLPSLLRTLPPMPGRTTTTSGKATTFPPDSVILFGQDALGIQKPAVALIKPEFTG